MIEIIPAIDIIDGKCVRLKGGDYEQKTIYGDDPVEVAKDFEKSGFRRLHIVDLDGAAAGRLVNTAIVRKICRSTSLLVDYGGGIRTRNDIVSLLNAGVNQFTAGSIAARNKDLVLEWLEEFGPERLILGADVKEGKIAVNGWKDTVESGLMDFIGSFIRRGLTSIICTDVSRDGMMSGPATELYRSVLNVFPDIDLIASGGVSNMGDLEALEAAGVKSVIVGKALYEKGTGLINSAPCALRPAPDSPEGRQYVSTGHIPSPSSAPCALRPAPDSPAVRIIPCLDVKNGRVVKGVNFGGLRDAGDPVELARLYSDQGADELVFLDIAATDENRKTMADMVRRVAEAVNIPFTVGGGIASVDDVTLLLSNGADKVSVNSAAVKNPELISELSARFGSQCVVLAVDAGRQSDGTWKVFVNGGKVATELDLFDWVARGVELGAGEILFTSIDNDGTGKGFAVEALSRVVARVNVPVIASGGAGKLEHFAEAVTEGKVSALLAAGLFHYGHLTIADLKNYLKDVGIGVRD
jgi:phosphoribosylformimino-5-aminoimidazole carboxamide ribotide isomerase